MQNKKEKGCPKKVGDCVSLRGVLYDLHTTLAQVLFPLNTCYLVNLKVCWSCIQLYNQKFTSCIGETWQWPTTIRYMGQKDMCLAQAFLGKPRSKYSACSERLYVTQVRMNGPNYPWWGLRPRNRHLAPHPARFWSRPPLPHLPPLFFSIEPDPSQISQTPAPLPLPQKAMEDIKHIRKVPKAIFWCAIVLVGISSSEKPFSPHSCRL